MSGQEAMARDLPTAGSRSSVLLVGGGQASWMIAKALRRDGFAGRITLVGDEDHPPYERPPLSKGILLGSITAREAYLGSQSDLSELGVTWIIDKALTIDRASRCVRTAGGAVLAWDHLVLATGGRARHLDIPGAQLAGVFSLRTLSDAARLKAEFVPGRRLVVAGGGWIGLEVAASARMAGLDVTLVEAAPRLCTRSLPEAPASFLLELHRARGTDIRLGQALSSIAGAGRVEEVVLGGGERLPADLVLAGIGMLPNIDLAAEAGIETRSGILVDGNGRTSDPAIFAAGDVAEERGTGARTESWANANEQAEVVAAAILGMPSPERPPAWFWSDQYDVNLQILGAVAGTESVAVAAPERGDGSWCYFDQGRLSGLVAVNRPRDVQVVRRLLQRGYMIDAGTLAAADGDLAQLLKSPPPSGPTSGC